MTTDPLAGIDLDSLPDGERIAAATLLELRAVREVVMQERRGRRITGRLAYLVALSVMLVIGGLVWSDRVDDARYSRSTCGQRIERSGQIHDAIVVAVDAIALYVNVPPEERRGLLDAADKAVSAELPPPDC